MASKSKKIFVIVDGHALLHRAWHALPSMTTPDGIEVRGAYGFTTMLLGAIKEFSPAYVAVAVDLEGGTFRNELYKEYKATREKKPDELYAQIDTVREILAAMNVPVFEAKGFEADDVIGTLTKRAAEEDSSVESVILTGDQDSFQLIDKRTTVYLPRRRDGKTVMLRMSETEFREEFGFSPIQIIDYKAIRGDASDNIPGVKGIGEVGATKLIQDFGSLGAIYEALEKKSKKAKEISEKTAALLVASKEAAMTALDLCRIRRDVPLEFALEACVFTPPTRERVASVFTKLGFMRLLQQMPAAKEPEQSATASLFAPAPKKNEDGAKVITDVAALDAMLAKIAKASAFAFRTAVVTEDVIAPKVAALGFSDGKTSFVATKDALSAGRPLIASFFAKTRQKICHNLKREHQRFAGLGIALEAPFFDLMLASYLMHSGERRHGIDSLLAYSRGVPLDDEAPGTDAEAVVARLAAEMPHLVPLAESFAKDLADNGLVKLNEDVELPLAAVLARMEVAGIAVDVPYLEKLSATLGKEIDTLVARIHEAAGEAFNINSPAQMKVVLFDKLGISPLGLKKTAKGKTLSTAAAELEKLRDSHPIVGDILDYRELAKLKSTYVDTLPALVHPKTGRIHAEFNQTVAATGRLSSSNPNLQNIPTSETDYGKRVRNGFVAPKGRVLVAADYSQIELRIAAHIAKEKTMIGAFKNGEDIHWRTAAEMFGEKDAASKRRIAKVINFGILYGMGPQRLAESADISFMEAREYIDKYFAIHKGIGKYMEDIKEKIVDDGYVETLFGRKRFFRNVRLMNPRDRAEAERQAINMPIQGSQADMIKIAMIRLDRHIGETYGIGAKAEVRMISQVHDELLFEVAEGVVDAFADVAVKIMVGVCELSVPVAVNVSIGKRWGDMEKR